MQKIRLSKEERKRNGKIEKRSKEKREEKRDTEKIELYRNNVIIPFMKSMISIKIACCKRFVVCIVFF